MGDLIERQKALDAIQERICQLGHVHNPYVLSITKAIRKLPSAEQWIPCESHHYPDEEEDVLVCSDTGNMCVTHGCKFDSLDGEFEFFTPGWKFGEVVAWMPLPEPYKESSND